MNIIFGRDVWGLGTVNSNARVLLKNSPAQSLKPCHPRYFTLALGSEGLFI